MAKIGTSLTMCLFDIAKGNVHLEEVEFIITSTQYKTRDELVEGIRKTMQSRYLQKHIDNACYLWNTGRIFQSLDARTYKRAPTTKWIDVPPIFSYR